MFMFGMRKEAVVVALMMVFLVYYLQPYSNSPVAPSGYDGLKYKMPDNEWDVFFLNSDIIERDELGYLYADNALFVFDSDGKLFYVY